MRASNISVFVLLLLTYTSFVSAEDANDCVENIKSLTEEFANENKTDNILRIQKTFYKGKVPHYVTVYYCHKEPCNSESDAKFKYIWTDDLLFFAINYHLFRALTFQLADLGDARTQFFIVPEICNENINVSYVEELYQTLTAQVSALHVCNAFYSEFFTAKINWRR